MTLPPLLVFVALAVSAPPTGTPPSSPAQKAALKRVVDAETKHIESAPSDTDALYRLGLAWLSLGEPKNAVAPLQKLCEQDKDSVEGKLLLARALRLTGDVQESRVLLDNAIKALPDDASLRLERSQLARQMGENDVAVTMHRKAVELSPGDAALVFNLGELLQNGLRDTDGAIAAYKKAIELDPNLMAARVNLGKALADRRRYAEAKDVFTAAARDALADPDPSYNLGVLYLRENAPAQALPAFERAHNIDPKHAPTLNNLGVAYDAMQKPKEALEYFLKATQADPTYTEAYFNLGLSYLKAGDQRSSTRAFERALSLEPRASGPYTQLGSLYLQQGKKDRAIEAFKKAIEASKDDRKKNTEAFRGLAAAYLAAGQPANAVDVLRQAVSMVPDDPSAKAALGEALLQIGDGQAAIAAFVDRLKLQPGNEAKLDLARAYAQARVGAKAEAQYKDVLLSDAKNLTARLGLADLYLARAEYPLAEDALKAILAENPNDLRALGRLGTMHAHTGRQDIALPLLERVAELDPLQLDAKATLGYLYFHADETDKAMRVLKDLLQIDPRHALGLYYMGVTQYRKGQTANAEKSFIASSESDGTSPLPFFSLGELYEKQGKLDEAKLNYKAAAMKGSREANDALVRLEKTK